MWRKPLAAGKIKESCFIYPDIHMSPVNQVPTEFLGIPGTQPRDALLFSVNEEAGGETGGLAVSSP